MSITDMTDREKLEEILDLYTKLERHMQGFDSLVLRLQTTREQYDQQHRDFYHMLEELDFNAAIGSKVLKSAKNMARLRRENKNICELAENVQKVFTDHGRCPMISAKLRNELKLCDSKASSIKKMATENGIKWLSKVK